MTISLGHADRLAPTHKHTPKPHTHRLLLTISMLTLLWRSNLRMIGCYCPALGWWEMHSDGIMGNEEWQSEQTAKGRGVGYYLQLEDGSALLKSGGFLVWLCSCVVRPCDGCWKVGSVSGMWWVLNDGFGGFFSHGHGFNSPRATEALLGQDPVFTFCRKFVISLGVFLISQFIYKSISLSLWWHTHGSLTDHRMLIAHEK